MEENREKQVWQRVRGSTEPDQTQVLRRWLEEQGKLWCVYRLFARRGGKCRALLEQKENQIACLRGLLRVRTGQIAAHPRPGEVRADLLPCFAGEQRFLRELLQGSREEDFGPIFAALAEGQKRQCRILLEILGNG